MNLNEFLATEIMGWKVSKGRHDKFGPITHRHYSDPRNKDFWLDTHDWDPTENISQAIQCAEKVIHWKVGSLPGDKSFFARAHDRAVFDKETPAEALSLAVARARGYEG